MRWRPATSGLCDVLPASPSALAAPSSSSAAPSPRRRRTAQNATNATRGQPMPMRSRFEPVMFAAAYCVYVGSPPPVYEKYRSTAYSGRTAIRARIAIARLPEMSTWAASAAHDRRTADATTPAPKTRTVSSGERTVPVSRIRIAGTATLAVTPSLRHIDRPGRPTTRSCIRTG